MALANLLIIIWEIFLLQKTLLIHLSLKNFTPLNLKSYSDVPLAEITVMVVANLFLVPNYAVVMNGATVPYHAERSLSESNEV